MGASFTLEDLRGAVLMACLALATSGVVRVVLLLLPVLHELVALLVDGVVCQVRERVRETAVDIGLRSKPC